MAGLIGGDDVAAVDRGSHLVGAQAHLLRQGSAFDGAAGTSKHVVARVALGAECLKVVGVDAQCHIGAVLDGAGEVVGKRFIGAGGDVEALDEQHAPVASVGVGCIGEVAGQSLLAVEDDVVAHAVHAVGGPQGIGAQVDAHREVGHNFVVHLVAAAKGGDAGE